MGPFLCLDTAASTLILGTVTAELCPQGEAAFDEVEVGWGAGHREERWRGQSRSLVNVPLAWGSLPARFPITMHLSMSALCNPA